MNTSMIVLCLLALVATAWALDRNTGSVRHSKKAVVEKTEQLLSDVKQMPFSGSGSGSGPGLGPGAGPGVGPGPASGSGSGPGLGPGVGPGPGPGYGSGSGVGPGLGPDENFDFSPFCDVFNREIDCCIPANWLCDGWDDCADGWDENPDLCMSYICPPHLPAKCQTGEHAGMCMPGYWICDNWNDCGDASDEIIALCGERDCGTCDQNTVDCGTNICIPPWWVCDEWDDCGNDSDEQGCDARSFKAIYGNYKRNSMKSADELNDRVKLLKDFSTGKTISVEDVEKTLKNAV